MAAHADLAKVAETVWADLHQPLIEAAQAAATDILEAHGSSVTGILFYGSCLRKGTDDDGILDFYVLADDLSDANHSKILGFFNKLLPPNVYYRETEWGDRTIRSKYAVMSSQAFAKAMGARWNVSFWGRFIQPAVLAYVRDDAAEAAITESIVSAIATAMRLVAPCYNWPFTADELWSRVFELTYRAELRSENATLKGREIFGEYDTRYRELTVPALGISGLDMRRGDGGRFQPAFQRSIVWGWRFRKVYGKFLSLMRLVKSSVTFQGGIDYLAWKIKRHSGVEIEISPWQRRHQLLGGLSLFLKTRRRGGFS